jgi:hypothetical protein
VWSGDLFGDAPTSRDRGDSWQRGGGGAAFAGWEFRRFGENQNVPGIPVALLEDVIALGGALAVCCSITSRQWLGAYS